jgi:hypothetical protein
MEPQHLAAMEARKALLERVEDKVETRQDAAKAKQARNYAARQLQSRPRQVKFALRVSQPPDSPPLTQPAPKPASAAAVTAPPGAAGVPRRAQDAPTKTTPACTPSTDARMAPSTGAYGTADEDEVARPTCTGTTPRTAPGRGRGRGKAPSTAATRTTAPGTSPVTPTQPRTWLVPDEELPTVPDMPLNTPCYVHIPQRRSTRLQALQDRLGPYGFQFYQAGSKGSRVVLKDGNNELFVVNRTRLIVPKRYANPSPSAATAAGLSGGNHDEAGPSTAGPPGTRRPHPATVGNNNDEAGPSTAGPPGSQPRRTGDGRRKPDAPSPGRSLPSERPAKQPKKGTR